MNIFYFKQTNRLAFTVYFALFAFGIKGCGSTQTVDSKDVPSISQYPDSNNKTPENPNSTGNSTPVSAQNIYQSYSLNHFPQKNSTRVLVQFRVGNSRGDTIRLSSDSQITANGLAMRKIDGDTVNTVTTLLNHITLLPIFSLFRTGTFYTQEVTGAKSVNLEFRDESKSVVKTSISPIQATALFNINMLKVKNGASSYKVGVSNISHTKIEGEKEIEATCELNSQSKQFNEELKREEEIREYSKVTGKIESNGMQCEFSAYDLAKHSKAEGNLEVKIRLEKSLNKIDSFGRTQTLHISSEWRETTPAL
jgi:hypothetical protein